MTRRSDNTIFPEATRMRRPRLLVRAARIGARFYRTQADNLRLLAKLGLEGKAQAFDELYRMEAQMEARRKAGDGRYSATRHVELLTALLAQMQQAGI